MATASNQFEQQRQHKGAKNFTFTFNWIELTSSIEPRDWYF